ncbi:unnamed protein product, partial [Discosporangium mesarthrocarpum]
CKFFLGKKYSGITKISTREYSSLRTKLSHDKTCCGEAYPPLCKTSTLTYLIYYTYPMPQPINLPGFLMWMSEELPHNLEGFPLRALARALCRASHLILG